MTKMSTTTNLCISGSKQNGIQMTMKYQLVSFGFSSCERFSDQCKHYSTWPTFLEHCSLCSSEILYVKLLLDVSQTPQAYWYCVCRTNRGQPKVTRRFGTVLSTESVVAVLQGTQSELLLNLLQLSRTEVISVTTNWGDRHMACCSSQTESKIILFITIRPLYRINRAFVILQFFPNKRWSWRFFIMGDTTTSIHKPFERDIMQSRLNLFWCALECWST